MIYINFCLNNSNKAPYALAMHTNWFTNKEQVDKLNNNIPTSKSIQFTLKYFSFPF